MITSFWLRDRVVQTHESASADSRTPDDFDSKVRKALQGKHQELFAETFGGIVRGLGLPAGEIGEREALGVRQSSRR